MLKYTLWRKLPVLLFQLHLETAPDNVYKNDLNSIQVFLFLTRVDQKSTQGLKNVSDKGR